MIYSYKTKKGFWEYKRNIVRIVFILFWLLMTVYLFFHFSGYEKRAFIIQWSYGVICLYLGTVTMYLADVRNRDYYNNLFTMLFCRFIGVLGFLLLTYFSVTSLKDTVRDTFISPPIIKQLKVIERKSESKSYDRVVFSGDIKEYKAVPGYVKLEVGRFYTVKIFTNSRIAIGIDEMSVK